MSSDGNLLNEETGQSTKDGEDSPLAQETSQDLDSLSKHPSTAPSASTPSGLKLTLFTLFGFILPAAALMPLLFVATRELWNQTSFRFFPISIVLGFGFLFTTCQWRMPSPARARIAIGVCLVGAAVGIWGMYLVSPVRAHLALVLLSLGWALGAFGTTPWTRVMAIMSLLVITVPLPLALSFRFQAFLGRLCGSATSAFLEAVQFPNVLDYNLLRIEGKQLNLVEVLSDAGSCFALAAFAILWTVYQRKPAMVAMLVVVSSFFWSFFFGCVKLLIVAFLFHSLTIDATSGIYAIVVSLLTFLMSMLCILLTSVSLTEALAPIKSKKSLLGLTAVYEEWVTWPKPQNKKEDVATSPCFPWQWSLYLSSSASLVLGVLCLWVLFVRPQPQSQDAMLSQNVVDAFPSKSALPEQFGPLKLANFSSNTQDANKNKGLYTHLWQYNAGETQFVVSLDFPFASWTSMVDAYKISGWEIENAAKETRDAPGPWTLEQVSMRNSFGIRAYSWDAFFDQAGNPMSEELPREQKSRDTLLTMLSNDRTAEIAQRRFRVRLFLETGREISDEESKQYQAFFLDIFERIRVQSMPALSLIK
jgi:hypothetical protein